MEKSEFKNKIFEYSLIGYLILLLCWNLYAIDTGNLYGLIPIGIQGVLLFLIFSKNKYAKNGIKIWAIILILSHGLLELQDFHWLESRLKYFLEKKLLSRN